MAVFWTLLIVYLCLKRPSFESGVRFPYADKIVHGTFYFGFVLVWFRVGVDKMPLRIPFLRYLFLVAVVFGVLIELAQKYLTTTRHADIWDVVANSTGAVLGIALLYFLLKPKK